TVVVVTPSQVTVSQNSTQDFTAAAADALGHPVAGTPSWQSNNTALVTIDTSGHATIGPTSSITHVTITATISGVQGTSTMTVDPSLVPVDHVTISGGNVTLTSIGDTNPFSAKAFDAANNQLPRTITWSISDATLVSIDLTGLATAKANGTATATASAGGKSDSRLVTVQQVVVTVSVSPSSASIAKGSTQQFSATAKDARGVAISPTPATTWDTSNHAIATIDSNGLATGASSGGPITVTATISTVPPGTAQLTVTPAVTTTTIEWSLAAQTTTVVTTISAGQQVQWHNADTTHSVVPDSAPPPQMEGPAATGATYGAQTIATAGTYHYHCGIHPTMHGTIVVQ
ncbi:MAG: hypothetical protein E6J78_13800, partial [Deltaproteobacteria bacterium]